MWTAESRALVGDFGAGQALSDEQYTLLAPLTACLSRDRGAVPI
jgi:hypothetical protein